jgi:hypothetical protein
MYMNKSKNKFSVKKVRRVMRVKSDNFEPATYEVWKVSGPRKFVKYFVTKKDAQAFIKSHTDTTMTLDIVTNLLREIKYK